MLKELRPVYDSAKSFYRKAYVFTDDDLKVLKSYDTIVASINDNNAHIYLNAHEQVLSQTTLRHIREFLKQNGFMAVSKKDIIKNFGTYENYNGVAIQ